MKKTESTGGEVRLERPVRRCPICNEGARDKDDVLINYSIGGGEFMMHSVCAARHFQQALRNIDWGQFPGDEYRNGERVYASQVLVGLHLPDHA